MLSAAVVDGLRVERAKAASLIGAIDHLFTSLGIAAVTVPVLYDAPRTMTVGEVVEVEKPAAKEPTKPKTPAAGRAQHSAVEARDAAILALIKRGVCDTASIRRQTPVAAGRAPDGHDMDVSNALTRMRAKGLIMHDPVAGWKTTK